MSPDKARREMLEFAPPVPMPVGDVELVDRSELEEVSYMAAPGRDGEHWADREPWPRMIEVQETRRVYCRCNPYCTSFRDESRTVNVAVVPAFAPKAAGTERAERAHKQQSAGSGGTP